ncbi:ankyrin repeat-containing domain protein, partial [Schizophyllum amplum]
TPLHLAAEHGDLELVRLFIDRHVDTRTRSGDGYEPLHFAAKGGHIAVCRLLLDHGAAVDARNYLGHTPLLLAAGGTDTPDILSLLISRGADVYARNNSDDSALQLAVLNDREKNMRML